MLFGHDEGKNAVQLCDGNTEAVSVEMGGTGAKTKAEAQEKLGIVSKTLLWKNESPGSAFEPQTIPLDLSGYDEVLIEYRLTDAREYTDINIVPVGNIGILNGAYADVGTFYSRKASVTKTGIYFQTADYCNAISSTKGTMDIVCIPVTIYGINGVQLKEITGELHV